MGLVLLLYPSVSNYWNTTYATHAISDYTSQVEKMEAADYRDVWENAIQYNRDLREMPNRFNPDSRMKDRYNRCLNIAGTGIMGYIDISSLGISLPLYHGTSDDVLVSAVGHIDWSSLPTGGAGTHCVVSGHRGLPSAKLFTDLDELREGDTFTMTVLDEVLTYEVDQIRTVLPSDVSYLNIENDKDLCTLVTCTPYAVNTHRLLVRGHRIATGKNYHIISEAVVIDPLIVATCLAIPLLLILFIMVMLKKPEKKVDIRALIHEESLK